MGLKELIKAAREKEFEEFLASYGITKSDLCKLHDLIQNGSAPAVVPHVITKDEAEKIKEQNKRGMTMEELAKTFEGDVVEFYENGKKPEKSNN